MRKVKEKNKVPFRANKLLLSFSEDHLRKWLFYQYFIPLKENLMTRLSSVFNDTDKQITFLFFNLFAITAEDIFFPHKIT